MMNSTRFKSNHFFLRGFFILTLILIGFTVQAATLTVSTSTLSVGYNQRKVTFDITADVSWSISTSLTWVDFDYSSGSSNETITVYIDPNTSTTGRTGTITISGSGVTSKTITITQTGVSADGYESNDSEAAAYNANLVFNNDVAVISIDSASIHSNADVDYYKVNLPAGYTYKINSKLIDSWSSYDYSVDGKYSYKIGSSESSTEDTKLPDFTYTGGGSVYFKVEPYTPGDYGSYCLKIVITRGAGAPTLAVSSNSLALNAVASTSNITVTSNTNWSVSKTASWLSVSPNIGSNNGTLAITTENNTDLSSRSATIVLTANGTLDQTINITQAGTDLSADSYEPNQTEAAAKELTVAFTNNMANIITSGAKISTSSDLDYYKIYLPTGYSYAISALLHDSYENSSLLDAKVSYKVGSAGSWSSTFDTKITDFTYAGGDYIYFEVQSYSSYGKGAYSLDLSINRNATGVTPTLSVSVATLSLAANDNSTTTFTVTSNSGWKVASDEPWITVSPASGWGNGTVTVTGMANVGSSSRSASLTVSCSAATSQTIAVTQTGGGSPAPDSYEANETEATASTLTATFTNDKATILTTGANIHSSTDADYYRIQLPAGYSYMVSSRLHDNAYSNDNEYFSLDAKYSVKEGASGTWGYTVDESLSDFVFAGGDYIYFKVVPYYAGDKGTYALDITITRALGTATLSVSPASLTVNAAANSTASFTITSNGAWTLTSSKTWLTPSITSGTGNATITLTASVNGNETERYAYIEVSGKGVLTQEIDITQNGIDLSADSYEANNTENTAYAANIAYNNNVGSFTTSGANIHSSTDVDYYKVSLAAGYNYTINSSLIETTADAKVSYKVGTAGTWSSTYDTGIPEFTAIGGVDLYFKVESYYSGEKGKYDINISITRKAVSLTLSETAINLAATASTASFNITSNVNWTVTSSQTWLTVGTASGSNNGTITLNATANPNTSVRSAIVTVSGSGITKTITVNQATSTVASLTLSATTLSIAAIVNSTATFDITSNIAWTASSSETWLTLSSASGTNNATITLTAAANTALTTRTSTVTVIGSGITRTITVTQAGAGPILTVSAATLNVNAAAASTVTFDITSNTSWTVASSETWLTASSASGSNNATITLTAAINANASTRSASVTVTGSGITKTITVTQASGNAFLNVSAATLNVNATAASTVTFDVTSNTTWTITSSQTWLTASSVSGSNNANITLTAAINTSLTARTSTITVTGSGIAKTITVTQAGADPILTVSATTLNVNATASSTVTFDISSNTSWTIASSQTWLTTSSANGSNNATITLTAAANPSASTRNASITVTGSGITRTITVTQLGITTGMNDIILQDVKFYPNPVINKLTVELDNQSRQNQVLIYSDKGELKSNEAYNTNNLEIDMSMYNAGVYIVKIISPNGTKTIKIFKN